MEYEGRPYIIAATTIMIVCTTVLLMNSLKKKNKQRRWWVRPWILKRDQKGAFSLVNEEFEAAEDNEGFKNFLRMDKATFFKLLEMVYDDIKKESTLMRNSISPKDRLVITLRFLATGESYRSLQYYFRIGHSTLSVLIPEVCNAILKRLQSKYLKVPTTSAEWLNIAEDFNQIWNFPNALGAMDGKHILFNAPRHAGSAFYNYKQCNSIVLLAVADANYKFTYIDCGTNGRVSDGGVFQRSSLAAALQNNFLNIPEERPLPGRRLPMPLVFVADAAFPLQRNILKPFPLRNMQWPQRIFNYRLSRARRVIENTFGILANRWRVLLTTINLAPEKVQIITETCCVLHNFLLVEFPSEFSHDADEQYKFIYGLRQQGGNRARGEAIDIRNEYMQYFNQEGAVEWQNNIA